MPGRLKVHIAAARHLPVMDRASELTDAFVEVIFLILVYAQNISSSTNEAFFLCSYIWRKSFGVIYFFAAANAVCNIFYGLIRYVCLFITNSKYNSCGIRITLA